MSEQARENERLDLASKITAIHAKKAHVLTADDIRYYASVYTQIRSLESRDRISNALAKQNVRVIFFAVDRNLMHAIQALPEVEVLRRDASLGLLRLIAHCQRENLISANDQVRYEGLIHTWK